MADISGEDFEKALIEELGQDKNNTTKITITKTLNANDFKGLSKDIKEVSSVITMTISPIAQRIQSAMEYKSKKDGIKLSWNGLSQALEMSPGAPTNWKKGKVSKETLEKIAEYTGVDFAWLVTGEGRMAKGENDKLALIGAASSTGIATLATGTLLGGPATIIGMAAGAIAATAFDAIGKKISNTRLQNALEQLENEDPDLVSEIKQDVENAVEKKLTENINNVQRIQESSIRLVPLISFVQAGSFREAILNAQDEYVATYAGDLGTYAFALEVVGDSMFPEFKPGDKIIVDPDVKPLPGDYVIAQNDGDEATFKKYKPRGFDEHGREYFELIALNENYPNFDSRFQNIKIIATVIDHIRNLRR
mgnify:CR=1 FL=1